MRCSVQCHCGGEGHMNAASSKDEKFSESTRSTTRHDEAKHTQTTTSHFPLKKAPTTSHCPTSPACNLAPLSLLGPQEALPGSCGRPLGPANPGHSPAPGTCASSHRTHRGAHASRRGRRTGAQGGSNAVGTTRRRIFNGFLGERRRSVGQNP